MADSSQASVEADTVEVVEVAEVVEDEYLLSPPAAPLSQPADPLAFDAPSDLDAVFESANVSSQFQVAPGPPRVSPPNSGNLRRDGKLLVVPVGKCRFPPRCIKSNTPLGEDECVMATVDIPSLDDSKSVEKAIGFLVGGPIGRGVVSFVTGRRDFETYDWPIYVSKKYSLLSRGLRYLSYAMMGFAALACVAIILFVSLLEVVRYDDRYAPAVSMVIVVSLFGGACLFAFSGAMMLRPKRRSRNYVWVAGAGKDFLDSLANYDPRIDH